MKTMLLLRRTLLDPVAVRDGANPEMDAAIEAQVKARFEERVAEAIKEATAPLRETIDRLSQNRDSILREKRELERAAVKQAEDREAERPKFVPITKQQARDPQIYRRVKAEAEKLGIPMKILDAEKMERRGNPPMQFQNLTHYFVSKQAIIGDHTAYKRHRAEAEKRGLRFIVAESPNQFPKEAFSGEGQ